MTEGQKLMRKALERSGLSKYEIAKRYSLSRGALTNIEKGHRKPEPYAIFILADLAGEDEKRALIKIEAEGEKQEKKKAYWKEKISHGAVATVAALCVIGSIPYSTHADAKNLTPSIHYTKHKE